MWSLAEAFTDALLRGNSQDEGIRCASSRPRRLPVGHLAVLVDGGCERTGAIAPSYR